MDDHVRDLVAAGCRILFNEGQRRYLESLNAYARSIVQPAGRPEVDAVFGIPPTVAIEQRLSRGGRKSTVATTTEVWHFLRLLWVKLGLQRCVHDGAEVRPQSVESIAAQLMRDHKGEHVGLLAPLVVARKGVYTDLAKWAKARGHTHLRVDGAFLPVDTWPRLDRFKEHTLELPVGDLVIAPEREDELQVLSRHRLGEPIERLQSVLDATQVVALQHAVRRVKMDESINSYLLDIVDATRQCDELRVGVSTRGALCLYRASQALAMIENRDFVIPDDVKRLALPVLSHRVIAKGYLQGTHRQALEALVTRLVEEVRVPR